MPCVSAGDLVIAEIGDFEPLDILEQTQAVPARFLRIEWIRSAVQVDVVERQCLFACQPQAKALQRVRPSAGGQRRLEGDLVARAVHGQSDPAGADIGKGPHRFQPAAQQGLRRNHAFIARAARAHDQRAAPLHVDHRQQDGSYKADDEQAHQHLDQRVPARVDGAPGAFSRWNGGILVHGC